jgi:hypothetical protein
VVETGEITQCGVSIKCNKTWIVLETGEITQCGVSIKYNKTWILLETGEITQCGVSIKYNKTWILLETGEITLWCINKIQYRPAHVFTSIKRSPISCPVIENFI